MATRHRHNQRNSGRPAPFHPPINSIVRVLRPWLCRSQPRIVIPGGLSGFGLGRRARTRWHQLGPMRVCEWVVGQTLMQHRLGWNGSSNCYRWCRPDSGLLCIADHRGEVASTPYLTMSAPQDNQQVAEHTDDLPEGW